MSPVENSPPKNGLSEGFYVYRNGQNNLWPYPCASYQMTFSPCNNIDLGTSRGLISPLAIGCCEVGDTSKGMSMLTSENNPESRRQFVTLCQPGQWNAEKFP